MLILDLVEERFPSRHAMVRDEDFEEERRLMYVACTRAKDTLDLFSPSSVFSRMYGGLEPASPSPFVRELPSRLYDEIVEGYGGVSRCCGDPFGGCDRQRPSAAEGFPENPPEKPADPAKLGFCRHKVFGRGKVVEELPPDRYRVHFPGFGLKVIIGDYLEME